MYSGFQVLDSSLRQWNLVLDSSRWWDSGFLELYRGFQNPGLLIPRAKISQIPESLFPYMGRRESSDPDFHPGAPATQMMLENHRVSTTKILTTK